MKFYRKKVLKIKKLQNEKWSKIMFYFPIGTFYDFA